MIEIFNNMMNMIINNSRILISSLSSSSSSLSSTTLSSSSPRWKVALWEKNSIEPAMLRVPIVVIVFLFLWGINLWFLEVTNILNN